MRIEMHGELMLLDDTEPAPTPTGKIYVYAPIDGMQTLVAWKDSNGEVHRAEDVDPDSAARGEAILNSQSHAH